MDNGIFGWHFNKILKHTMKENPLYIHFIIVEVGRNGRTRVARERALYLQVSRDLLLQGLNVLNELLARRFEEKVPVGKPSRVAKADELEKLGEEGESVDGVDDGARQPDGRESSNRVDDESRLVLDLLPLQKSKKEK
jgi:hypothetical protein